MNRSPHSRVVASGRGRTIWRTAEGEVETGVWECDAGRFHADFGAFGELIHVISGEGYPVVAK